MDEEKEISKRKRLYEHDICMIPCTDEDVKRAKEYMINNREKWIKKKEEGKAAGTWTGDDEWQYGMQVSKGPLAFINNVILIRSNIKVSEDAETFKAQMDACMKPVRSELFSGYEYNPHEMAIVLEKISDYSKMPGVDMGNFLHREAIRSIIDKDLIVWRMTRKMNNASNVEQAKGWNSLIKEAERERRQIKIDMGLIGKKGGKLGGEGSLRDREEAARKKQLDDISNKYKKDNKYDSWK